MASIKILRKIVLNCLKEFGRVTDRISVNIGTTTKNKLIKLPHTNTIEKLVDNFCLDCMKSPLSII